MPTNWKSLEDHVRGIAQLRWNSECKAEHVDGVDFDGVIRAADDEIVLIEITKERTLEKVRADLNKLVPTKIRLATQGVMCRAFVILAEEPTPSMVEAGLAVHVTVASASAFERSFFDFSAYNKLRSALPFGSAVDAKTGENDRRGFVPVKYSEPNRTVRLSISDLVSRILRGGKIALTGDYGTGKSRCVREVYLSITEKIREAGAFPVAINLRDHWSSSNALEILAGHLGNIGLSSSIDNLVRLLNSGHLILLLDGFDEIGAQSHDMRVDDRKALRRHAVRGVRDLIHKSKAGVLVTGRSHFFDSDEEMLQSLGIGADHSGTTILSAPETFTQQEGEQYLAALGIEATLPNWLPRKPLVFQILVELDRQDVTRILTNELGEFEFWGAFVMAVCVRESRGVANSISPETIRHILLQLAAKSRYSSAPLGRLTPKDIDTAYEVAVGTAPDQTGRQLLARMCTLGRIEPESPDRQFVDYDVVDVLRADRLILEVVSLADPRGQGQWQQSLRTLGIIRAASTMSVFDLGQMCFAYLRKHGTSANTKRLGELVSALTLFGDGTLDFQGLQLRHSELPMLNLNRHKVVNLRIRESVIGALNLENSSVEEEDAFSIEGSVIANVAGVSSEAGLPSWIKDTEVIEFDRVSNAARIKDASLSPPQKLFLAIIHKLFFQPGAGREESSLLKGGYGQRYTPKLVEGILKLLLREGLVEKFKGDDGWVYKPVRRYTERMNRIRAELTLSDDALWKEVSTLRE